MAVVKGMREEVHLQLYDTISIGPKEQLRKVLTSNTLRFFVDVTGKTPLETNMQASSLLPHWNTYEVRAMRVVFSDLPAEFADIATKLKVGVVDKYGNPVSVSGSSEQKTVEIEQFTLTHFVDFKREVVAPLKQPQRLSEVELEGLDLTLAPGSTLDPGHEFAEISRATLRRAAEQFGQSVVPPDEQIYNRGSGGVISKFIYNTVTTLDLGEKRYAQAPTLFFPAGAGPYSGDGQVTTHGFPSPQATYVFATAVPMDAGQNFSVKIEIPSSRVQNDLQTVWGPFSAIVFLDGLMKRDVQ